jgi:hypothetical protein
VDTAFDCRQNDPVPFPCLWGAISMNFVVQSNPLNLKVIDFERFNLFLIAEYRYSGS